MGTETLDEREPGGEPDRPARAKAARGPGRPQGGQEDVRDALLEAASGLFAERGYDAASMRELARAAGVTPAMISYYFGDKQGLLEAVADRAFDRLLAGIRTLAREHPEEALAPALIRLYIDVIGREPWIPLFVVREVVSRDGPARAHFMERFGARAAEVVPLLFAREIEAGRLRRDIDPRLAILSLFGMSVFPFLAYPVMGPLLGYRIDAAFREQLTAHTIRVYLEGAGGDAR